MRYEIGLEVESGYIVWAYGGFPAGSNRDIDISRKRFVKKLQPNERAVADKGYRHSDSFYVCENNDPCNKRIKQILARHENVNRRVKTFDCMSGVFRHDLSLHRDYFYAVVNIVQISIENGDKLPEISQA